MKRSTVVLTCTHTHNRPPQHVSLPLLAYHACCQTNHFCGVGCEMGFCVFYLYIVRVDVQAAHLQLSICKNTIASLILWVVGFVTS